MRHPSEFTALEWLELLPLRHAAKQLRNDAWLSFYYSKRPAQLDAFLDSQSHLAGKSIAAVIAFEQPWALNWLLRMAKRNVSDTNVLVFDNSRDHAKRRDIERACNDNGVAYLGLPANPTTHVNRSHGMAMSWVYRNVIRAIRPRSFGFLDHDLIPVRKATVADKLENQPIYGLVNVGKFGFWSLWAGYSFFDFALTTGKSINFLYDFSRDLDTGGRNWNSLYRDIDRTTMRLAVSLQVEMSVPSLGISRPVQFIDRSWLHLGGISYNDTLRDRMAFFEGLEEWSESASS
ncbi:MAG TPA: hypothetical protein VHB46_12135 [Burkholderiales bacterium]|nr:hypothetical protein [Burkholderiales bacterium]